MKSDRIEAMRQEYPIAVLHRVLELGDSSYYAWRRRSESPRSRENARLEIQIAAAHERIWQTHGRERLQADLLDHGVAVGLYCIRRIRTKLGLRCKQKRKFRNTTDLKHNVPVAPNFLERHFDMRTPSQAWVSDITDVWTDEGWWYLASIHDLFSGERVGYAMSERMTRALVMQALFGAVALKRPIAGLMLHLDRGGQYWLLRLSGSGKAIWHDVVHERQGRLLRQRAGGKLLGLVEERTHAPPPVHDMRSGPTGHHRIYRDLLQPAAQAGLSRLSLANRFHSGILYPPTGCLILCSPLLTTCLRP